jgi:tetratricopeptide (TPR) repeat protein
MSVEAVKDYTAAIALDDKQPNYFQCAELPVGVCFANIVRMYRALAYCAMVPPDYNSALADLEQSYNLSENKFKALLQRGFVKRRVGRPDEAVEDLRRALTLDAKNREAHNHLGMALLDSGHLEQVHVFVFSSLRSITLFF